MCTHTHTHMVKNIAIMDKVYNELLKRKLVGESFSNEIMRFLGKGRTISELAGSWKISEAEATEIKEKLVRLKTQTTERLQKKIQQRA